MSTFDDASLVMIPSGYKASKVYSVKPTDGTGDLTFTRALDTATRVAPNGLIERVRTNLALHSQAFDNVIYVKQNASIVANTTIAPDGTTTADTFDEGTLTTTHRLYQDFVVTANEEITLSVFVKKGTNDNVRIILNDLAQNFRWIGAQFNLTTLASSTAVGSFGGAVLISSSITDAGNGWYRLSITGNLNCTNLLGFVNASNATAITSSDDRGGISYTGTNKTLFLWGYQFEKGVATPYMPTTTAAVSVGMLANVPRLDYLGGGCPKLLLEPQRTNVITFSEQLNNAAWGNAGGTTTANTAISPSGFQDADTLTGARFQSNFASNTYTFSAFAKKVDGDGTFVLRLDVLATNVAVFNLNNGTIVSTDAGYTSTITNFGNGYFRCTLTTPANTAITNAVIISANGGLSSTFVYGCQLEAGSYPTSYIPTLGAAVTRSADAASKDSIGALFGSAYTLFGEITNQNVNNTRHIAVKIPSGSQYNNFITIFQSGTGLTATGNNAAAVTQFSIASGSFALGSNLKFALRCDLNNVAFYVNGVQIGTDNTATIPAVTTLHVGGYTDIREISVIKQTIIFPTALTNAQLAELTA